MQRRGVRRCKSYHLCGLGGLMLGSVTGLLGASAIASTTVAIESVVLAHIREQIRTLSSSDPEAARTICQIVEDEEEHHDRSLVYVTRPTLIDRAIRGVVSAATETVIWLGMRL